MGSRSDGTQTAMLKELRDVNKNLNDLYELTAEVKTAIEQGVDKICLAEATTRNALRPELYGVKVGLKELREAIVAPPRAETSTNDAVMAKKRTAFKAALAYCRLFVTLAIFGKGPVLETYGASTDPKDMEVTCAQWALGRDATAAEVNDLLEFKLVFDRAGIVENCQGHTERRNGKKKEKKNTLRERLGKTRSRVHEMLIGNLLSIWMFYAPGLQGYNPLKNAWEQSEQVKAAAREILKRDGDTDTPIFLGIPFEQSHYEECKELMSGCSAIIASSLTELYGLVPKERVDDTKREIERLDSEQGNAGRSAHEYDVHEGFLPHQLAFVFVKISARLWSMASHQQGRVRRGLQMGHYPKWIRFCLGINQKVDEDLVKDGTGWTYFRPIEAVQVYGVTMRGKISMQDVYYTQYILTGETSVDLEPQAQRSRIDFLLNAVEETVGDAGEDLNDEADQVVPATQI